MEKLLLSFLGTGNYQEVRYRFRKQASDPTRLSAAAIGSFFRDYQPVILTTKEAYEKNWPLVVESFDRLELPSPYHLDIPSGRSEAEIWEIVEILVGYLTERDAGAEHPVILDITHGFRAQPLLVFITVGLLEEMQYVRVENVLYGAFEARDEKGVAPIFDLRPLLDLGAWSRALGDLRRYGYATPLRSLLREASRRAYSGNTRYKPRGLVGLGDSLENIARALAALRPIQTHIEAKMLPKKLEVAKEDLEHLPELRPLAPFLNASLSRYVELGVGEQLASEEGLVALARMIELYLDLEQYPQAVTLAREALITLRCLDVGTDPFNSNARRAAESEVSAAETILRLGGKLTAEDIKRYADVWQELADLRNDVDHAGFRSSPRDARGVKKQALTVCSKVVRWLEERALG